MKKILVLILAMLIMARKKSGMPLQKAMIGIIKFLTHAK